jgi:hypothetical protein
MAATLRCRFRKYFNRKCLSDKVCASGGARRRDLKTWIVEDARETGILTPTVSEPFLCWTFSGSGLKARNGRTRVMNPNQKTSFNPTTGGPPCGCRWKV